LWVNDLNRYIERKAVKRLHKPEKKGEGIVSDRKNHTQEEQEKNPSSIALLASAVRPM